VRSKRGKLERSSGGIIFLKERGPYLHPDYIYKILSLNQKWAMYSHKDNKRMPASTLFWRRYDL